MATQPGAVVIVPFELDSLGNEASISFSFNFDPTKLSNPQVTLGNGAPAGAVLGVNTNEAGLGRVGVLVDSTNTYTAGTQRVINVSFNVAANAPIGLTPITFGGSPTVQSVSSSGGTLLATVYQSGNVQIGSTAAGVSLSGRVLTPDGRGLRNATVVLIDQQGIRRFATTSSFGIFTFEGVDLETYVMTVSSKRFRFAPQVLNVTDQLNDLVLIGME